RDRARGCGSQAGDLRRRGRSGEPRAPPLDLGDDRRARGAGVLAAHPRRGVRFARRNAAPQRRRSAAAVAGTIRASHPHHAHRIGPRGARSRDHGGVRRGIGHVARRRRTVGRRRARRPPGWSGGLMAVSRSWRQLVIEGPLRARFDDVADLNQVFSDSFTERYRRDGMVGVRVPFLNPAIWRYAIEDAADGAMLWRDERGRLVAFNMVHRSGAEGWMGPLAVRTEVQGAGTGKEIVTRGVDWLKSQGTRVIGLETMPRTMDNIGFYSRLGFIPGRLTLTVTLDAAYSDPPARLLGRLSPEAREHALGECAALVARLLPGYDYSREIRLTADLGLGDTVLLYQRDMLV